MSRPGFRENLDMTQNSALTNNGGTVNVMPEKESGLFGFRGEHVLKQQTEILWDPVTCLTGKTKANKRLAAYLDS